VRVDSIVAVLVGCWRHMALLSLAAVRIGPGMACPDKFRLQQVYEGAVGRWAQVQMICQLFIPITCRAEQIRKTALAERNAAKHRLVTHQQNCKLCNPRPLYRGT
jgi:hypothetical protein